VTRDEPLEDGGTSLPLASLGQADTKTTATQSTYDVRITPLPPVIFLNLEATGVSTTPNDDRTHPDDNHRAASNEQALEVVIKFGIQPSENLD
jgi:hypothetical protein